MTRDLTLAALLLAAACSQDPAPSVANEAANAAEAPPAQQPVPVLDGQWRVTAIDGKPLAAGAMTASFGDGAVSLSSGCIRRAWSYTQQRNAVSFSPTPGGSSNCGGQAPGAEAETAYAVVDGANIAVFDKDGKEATLSGTGGTLSLAR